MPRTESDTQRSRGERHASNGRIERDTNPLVGENVPLEPGVMYLNEIGQVELLHGIEEERILFGKIEKAGVATLLASTIAGEPQFPPIILSRQSAETVLSELESQGFPISDYFIPHYRKIDKPKEQPHGKGIRLQGS